MYASHQKLLTESKGTFQSIKNQCHPKIAYFKDDTKIVNNKLKIEQIGVNVMGGGVEKICLLLNKTFPTTTYSDCNKYFFSSPLKRYA